MWNHAVIAFESAIGLKILAVFQNLEFGSALPATGGSILGWNYRTIDAIADLASVSRLKSLDREQGHRLP